MVHPPREPDTVELGAHLRSLRRAHPTLAVLTEILSLDEVRVTIRATVRIDGETRAQGHAAQRADQAGDFVAVAERRAVEQALLLGGFGIVVDEPSSVAPSVVPGAAPADQAVAVGAGTVAAGDAAAAPERQRRRAARVERDGRAPIEAIDHADHEATLTPDSSGATASDIQMGDGTSNAPVVPALSPPPDSLVDAAPPSLPPDAASAVEAHAADESPLPAPALPRRKRDRKPRPSGPAQSDGEQAEPAIASGASSHEAARAVGPDGSEEPAAAQATLAQGGDAAVATPPRRARRSPGRTAPAPPAPAVADVQTPHDAARAAWRAGQPIPAWWPPDRTVVEQPLTRAQIERLRAVAIGEEITAAQLDAYSAMIFGRDAAALNQAEGAILEERLNPAYPSPLQELRVRRVLHPLAVGDTMTIPDDSAAFIRWRDVPVAEEEPAAPAVPAWRAGGIKRPRKRARR